MNKLKLALSKLRAYTKPFKSSTGLLFWPEFATP